MRVATLLALMLVVVPSSASVRADARWQPTPGTSWQWQLAGPLDTSAEVAVYDVDLFTTDASDVAALHDKGRKVICYLSAGTLEDFRPDRDTIPAEVVGRDYASLSGEKWLDIRRLDVLGPTLSQRLDLCREKGFDAVEPDNIDGYRADTGFALTAADQLNFNRWLASEAHARGLAIALKNEAEQVDALLDDFDFAIVESCFQLNECDAYQPFVRAGKAVFATEYRLDPSSFCPEANTRGFDALKKNLDLSAERVACRDYPPLPTPATSAERAPSPAPAPEVQPSATPVISPTLAPTATPQPAKAVAPVYGVTMDAVDDLPAIVDALRGFRRRPTTRIVFDREHDATYYADPVRQIHAVSGTLGLLLDASVVAEVSADAVAARTRTFLSTLGDEVDIWEVGNEVNGYPWLGETSEVVPKMTAAFDIIDQARRPTALTLYYNQGCENAIDHEMFSWAEANVPPRMRQGLTYVLISYYEDDCNGLQPDWPLVFDRLGRLFPGAKLGFGEIGTLDPARKATYMRRYYGMRINHPAWIGGFFWWWGRQDVVPRTQPLWAVLDESFGP